MQPKYVINKILQQKLTTLDHHPQKCKLLRTQLNCWNVGFYNASSAQNAQQTQNMATSEAFSL